MTDALVQLNKNIARVVELGSISHLLHKTYPLLKQECDEILRSQVVLIVSSFDTFIHDCVRVKIINIFVDKKDLSTLLSSYSIDFCHLMVLDTLDSIQDKINYLDGAIRDKNAKDSYQSPKSIEYASGLMNITKIWAKLSDIMHEPAKDIKDKLSLIIDRRNKIVHESDYNSITQSYNPISEEDVVNIVDFVRRISMAIYEISNQ